MFRSNPDEVSVTKLSSKVMTEFFKRIFAGDSRHTQEWKDKIKSHQRMGIAIRMAFANEMDATEWVRSYNSRRRTTPTTFLNLKLEYAKTQEERDKVQITHTHTHTPLMTYQSEARPTQCFAVGISLEGVLILTMLELHLGLLEEPESRFLTVPGLLADLCALSAWQQIVIVAILLAQIGAQAIGGQVWRKPGSATGASFFGLLLSLLTIACLRAQGITARADSCEPHFCCIGQRQLSGLADILACSPGN